MQQNNNNNQENNNNNHENNNKSFFTLKCITLGNVKPENFKFSPVKEVLSNDKIYTWKESNIKYEYIIVDSNGNEKIEESDAIYEFPVLKTGRGIIDYQGVTGDISYSIISSLNIPEASKVIDDLKLIKRTCDNFYLSNFPKFTGMSLQQYRSDNCCDDNVPDNMVINTHFKQFFKPKTAQYCESIIFKLITSKNTGNIITKFYGINGQTIDPAKLYNTKFTFQPYCKLQKIFYGTYKTYQFKLHEALILSLDDGNDTDNSVAYQKAQQYLMNEPEKSKLFDEAINKAEIKNLPIKVDMSSSLAKNSVLGVNKSSISYNDEEDDGFNNPPVQVPIVKTVQSISSEPKKRIRNNN